MEFTEISSHGLRHDIYRSFCLSGSNGKKFACTAGNIEGAVLFTTKYVPDSSPIFNLHFETATANKPNITANDESEEEKCAIFNHLDIYQRQRMGIDPAHCSEFSISNYSPRIEQVCFLPDNTEQHPNGLLAVLTSNGSLEIRSRMHFKRDWNVVVADISRFWQEYCKPEKVLPNAFNRITNCCWSTSVNFKGNILYTGTVNGKIINFEIKLNQIRILFTYNTGMYNICLIKNFSNESNNLLVVGDASGACRIFKVTENNCTDFFRLFNKPDKMACRFCEIIFCNESGNLIIIVTKAAHLLVFLLSKDGELLNKNRHYVGNMEITGVECMKPYEFIVCTKVGYIEHVVISVHNNNIKITPKSLKHGFNFENNQLLGITSSRNHAVWIFALSPNKLMEMGPNVRTIAKLSVNTLNIFDSFDIMLNTNAMNYNDFVDCAEILRFTVFKYFVLNNDCIKLPPLPKEINRDYINRLKIYIIMVISAWNYYKQRSVRLDNVKLEIKWKEMREFVINANNYEKLVRLNALESHTPLQKFSLKYMIKMFKEFSQKDISDDLVEAKRILQLAFEQILSKNSYEDYVANSVAEKCQYCGLDIDEETSVCQNKHYIPRCCITFKQTSLFSTSQCDQCKALVLDDEYSIKEILPETEDIVCPLCDVKFNAR